MHGLVYTYALNVPGAQAHNVKAALVHCGALSSSMELLRQQEDATLCTDLSSMIYDLALSEPGLDIVCLVCVYIYPQP